MQRKQFILVDDYVKRNAEEYLKAVPLGWVAEFRENTRNKNQNAAQWPILQEFADQLQWPVNGQMVFMSKEEWKDVLTAAFKQETTRIAMGLNGGVVMLGMKTSIMSKNQFSEWLDFLHAIAADRGVKIAAKKAP